MQVKEIMSAQVDWIPPTLSVRDAAQRMRDEDIGALPIGENDKLIGMITDRDIVVRILPDGKDLATTIAREAMSQNLLYCFEDQDVNEVAANMGENQVRRLPVLNRDKRLVGMISLGDIAARASEKAAGEALGDISEDRN